MNLKLSDNDYRGLSFSKSEQMRSGGYTESQTNLNLYDSCQREDNPAISNSTLCFIRLSF